MVDCSFVHKKSTGDCLQESARVLQKCCSFREHAAKRSSEETCHLLHKNLRENVAVFNYARLGEWAVLETIESRQLVSRHVFTRLLSEPPCGTHRGAVLVQPSRSLRGSDGSGWQSAALRGGPCYAQTASQNAPITAKCWHKRLPRWNVYL